MLVLSRKPLESITIGDDIVVTVVTVRGERVRIAVDAPKSVKINRAEVQEAIDHEVVRLQSQHDSESSDPE